MLSKSSIRLTGKKIGKSAVGKVTGLSQYYRKDDLERLEIWVDKKVAGPLPCENNLRIPVQLIIGDQVYTAGLRSTPRNSYVWICPDLEDSRGKKARLAEVLGANGFEKNQKVLLEVEKRNIYLSHHV